MLPSGMAVNTECSVEKKKRPPFSLLFLRVHWDQLMDLFCASQLMNKSCQLIEFSSLEYFFLCVWNGNIVMEKLKKLAVEKSQHRSSKEMGSLTSRDG